MLSEEENRNPLNGRQSEEEVQMEDAVRSLPCPGGRPFTLFVRFLRLCEYVFAGAAMALLSFDATIVRTVTPLIMHYEPSSDELTVFLSPLGTFLLPLLPLVILAGTAFLWREYLLAGRPPFWEYARFAASAWRRRTRFRAFCDAVFGFVLLLGEFFFGAAFLLTLWFLYLELFVFRGILTTPVNVVYFLNVFFLLAMLSTVIVAATVLRHTLLSGRPPQWVYAFFLISAFVAMFALGWWFHWDWVWLCFRGLGLVQWWYPDYGTGNDNGLYPALLNGLRVHFFTLVAGIPLIGATFLHWRFAPDKKAVD
jgi:hypothetical protein